MMRWYPNPVLASPILGLAVVLVSKLKAISSNFASKLPLAFHPSEPPGAEHTTCQSNNSLTSSSHQLTLSRLVLGKLPRNLVKLDSIIELCQRLLLLGMLLALGFLSI